jgi:hypothetical protein
MAPIVESIEISRSPEDVFAYINDFTRHGEWQESIVSVEVEGGGPIAVGTQLKETRRVPGGKQAITYAITEHDPPSALAFRGLNGPVRPVGRVTVLPLDDGRRSRVTLELELNGHGLGKVLAPLARSQARKEVPASQRRLKERLESAAV